MTSPEPQADNQENFVQTPLESPAAFLESSPHTRSWPRLWLAALLLIGGGTALVWRLLIPAPPATSPTNAQPLGVRVKLSPVQTGLVEDSSDFVASLESRYSIKLQPTIQGQVTQIFVKLGDPVVKGTAVIQVNPRQQGAINGIDMATNRVAQVQLENARATLQSLQAERFSSLTDIRLNQQDYERYASLAAEGAVPRRMRDQYADKLATARSKLGAIDIKMRSLQAAVSQAETALQQTQSHTALQLQNYRIIAPVDGTIGDIPVKVGDLVNPAIPVATITQNQPLEIKISVPHERLPQLQKGIPVQLMGGQGQILGISQVFSIAPNPENNTQPIQIKALLNNSQGRLKANQLVRARVIWNQRPGILIPTTAVSRIAGNTFVYVAQTETSPEGVSRLVARQKQVKLGNPKRNNYQVLSGLQPDEKIIVSGLFNLRDGVPIVAETF
ncbi:MAG: efflux RND transporter periplasmic adaptor subunit [Goleter apudmare HA4340-LM2]|jgi:RND family efflux transporter MFP subunit|nr:efflux RND transporter periplasmic adaptor subunit [Goleter apudmare HA4340-LM2]